MAGGSPDHVALGAAVIGLLFSQLLGSRCRAHDSDLRVRVLATGLATYPDLSVICGRREHDPEDRNAIKNPTLLVEVTSPSTEEYDRGDKFEHYKRIASLEQYVIVSHGERRIEVWCREGDGRWTSRVALGGEVAKLPSIGCALDVDRLYDAAAEPRD
jgi:Uma2 family endonuclease